MTAEGLRNGPDEVAERALLGRLAAAEPRGSKSLAGLIERLPDPDDGRGRLVRLTARGLGLVDRVAPVHVQNERQLLRSLGDADQATLERLLRRLLGELERSEASPP